MSEEDKNIDLLIARHLAGESDDMEEQKLHDWLQESDFNRVSFRIIEESVNNTVDEGKLLITDGAFEKVMTHWDEKKPTRKFNQFGIIKSLIVSAASISLILLSVFTYKQLLLQPKSVADINQPVLIEKVCPEGQKTQVFLPDGSMVWLNSGSRLQYTTEYGDSLRSVSLTGEAYFEVIEDQTQPFQVKTGNIAVTTLNSSFNVNTLFRDGAIEVVLDDGLVLLENLFSSFVPGMPLRAFMKPGEKASYSLKNLSFEITEIENTYDYSCWKDGIISFRQTDFFTLINTLEKWYGVKFTWDDDPGSNWSFSGEFDDEYLDNVLQSLSQEEGFQFEKKKDEVKIIIEKDSDL